MPNEFKVKNGLLVSGSTNINSSGSSIFTIDGTSGRLFSVDDSLSGSLFSVNTAAGLPVIEAFSDNTVRIGQYGQRALFVSQSKVGIGKESALNGLLDVSGSITVTGSVNVTGSITGSLLGTASFAVSASWAPGGGAASSNLIFSGSVTASVNVSSTNAFNVVSASNTLIQVTPNRTLLVGDATQIPNEAAWKSPGVFGSGSANKVLVGYLVSVTNGATIGANNSNFSSWADLNIAGTNLIFRSSETEIMRMTSAGNFGIGVTSPGAKLHVAGAVSASNFTGSLLGTASFAISASFTTSASLAISASWAPSASKWTANGLNIYYNIGKVGIGVTAPTVALDIAAGSIKAGSNTATEGTVILQDYYSSGNLTNFGTNRSSGGPVISYASVPSTVTTNNFTSTFSSPAGRSAIILEDRISFYTTSSQTVTSGSAIGIAERVRIADTGQLAFYRYTSTSSFPGTVAAVLAVDSSGNVITTAASGSAGGGSGIPGGANTTIQFNDSNTFSGSGNFTFTKATNTVRIQASGSALLVISGSQGELLRIQDSGSSSTTLATISSGSRNVFTFTTSSLLVTGSIVANIETDALHYGRIVVTPSTNQNDYAPTGWNDADPAKATTLNINAGASIKITGLAGGTAGRLAVLKNSSTDRLIILEDSSSASTATNRFDLRNPIFLLPNGSATLLYDGVDNVWQPLGTSGGIGFDAFFDTYDDFIGAAGAFTTTAGQIGRFGGIGVGSGTSGQAGTYLVNTTEKPLGIAQIDTGTATTGTATLGSADGAFLIPANGQAVFLCRIAVEALSTAGDEYQIFAGFQDAVGTTNVTDGVYWTYTRTASTSWQGATANNSTRTTTGAAGPTVDTNYIWLGIYVNSTWTRATYFYSTDSLTWIIAGELTTNLPTSARPTGFGVTINKTAGGTQRNCSIDLLGFRYDIQRG
jgi:hypothetical protein